MATVQSRSAQSTSTTTVNVSITTAAGNLLGTVTGVFGGTPNAPTRTGDTFAATPAVADFADVGNNHLRADYAMSIASSANAVVGHSSVNGVACCVTEFSGRKTTLALGAVNHAVGTATTIQPGSITPTAASDLLAGTTDGGSGTAASTINSAFTVQEAGGAGTVWDEGGPVAGTATKDNVAASAVNPTWTTGHTGVADMGALIVEFLAAAGGASDPFPAAYFPTREGRLLPHYRL